MERQQHSSLSSSPSDTPDPNDTPGPNDNPDANDAPNAPDPTDAAPLTADESCISFCAIPSLIADSGSSFRAQVDPDSDDYDAFLARYPKAQVRDFDGNPKMISELDALIAYLQMLGTLVDFSSYDPTAPENLR